MPCVNFSGLRRRDIPGDFLSGVVGSLVIFREALSDLRLNPPSVFIVENTASLLGLPWVLECINQALDALPYHWRYPSFSTCFPSNFLSSLIPMPSSSPSLSLPMLILMFIS